MGFGSGGFGSSPFGSGVSGASAAGSYDVSEARGIAKDCVCITFSSAVVVNAAYKSASSYTVTDMETGSQLQVKQVLEPNVYTSETVYLKTDLLVPGREYRVQVSSVISRSGNPAQVDTVYFTYYWTKTDAILSSLPSVYDKSFESTVRAFLSAITKSDQDIGG